MNKKNNDDNFEHTISSKNNLLNFSFKELYNYKDLIGVEIDEELISENIKSFFKHPRHNLFIKDFFDFHKKILTIS